MLSPDLGNRSWRLTVYTWQLPMAQTTRLGISRMILPHAGQIDVSRMEHLDDRRTAITGETPPPLFPHVASLGSNGWFVFNG